MTQHPTVALIDEEEDFPDDVLSNHTDMVDSEPVVEVKRKFIRYSISLYNTS